MHFESGHKYKPTTYDMYYTTSRLYKTMYTTPSYVYWTGKVTETKEIRLDSDFTTQVGKERQLKAEVRTKTGTGNWSAYVDVSNRENQTTWKSDNPRVVTVDATGKIKALKKGTATITVNWKNDEYHITTKTKITVVNPPSISLEGNTNVCLQNGTVTLKAKYTEKDVTFT